MPLALISVVAATALGISAREDVSAPAEIAFSTSDGGEIHGLLYGRGRDGVVLAHGMVFDKESWAPLIGPLVGAGFRVLAIDFRGYGRSRSGSQEKALDLDVLGAIGFLKEQGAARISVVGASMGGGAAARAAAAAPIGEIDRLILLAPAAIRNPEKMRAGRIVYLTAEGDPTADRTRSQFERAPEPKSFALLPGDAHAQHVFDSEHSAALVEAIVAALTD